MALVLAMGVPFGGTISAYAATKDNAAQSIVMNSSESRTGKIVRVYVDEKGNTTDIKVLSKEMATMSASDVELVGTYTLSKAKTAQIKENIQGMTQASNLSAAIVVFLPKPYKALAAVARVAIFAQDIRWAGTYGHAIIMREYCQLPHTSYSHFYEYEIL